jgi:hypothetical protein
MMENSSLLLLLLQLLAVAAMVGGGTDCAIDRAAADGTSILVLM